MQFNSFDFMFFFPVVLLVYFIVPKKLRMPWLLVASYYFYMSWNPVYAVLIATSTVATFLCAIVLEKQQLAAEKIAEDDIDRETKLAKSQKNQKLAMILCLVLNLGILAVFKYANFAIGTIAKVTGHFGMDLSNARLDLLLPVGISFYTFQALGYIIDVYRKDVEVEHNIFRYALFVSFFPQLVAGPIERSKNLLRQMREIENIKLWNAHRVAEGAILMIWGFFMKMVIADRVAILVDTVFNNYREYGSVELCMAAIGFGIQIYCDFGSYSMIAIGCAKVMGFTLMENFNSPYLASSIKDFWGRWHISLSTWFRDYLYIPLGGNRKGKKRTEWNKLIVFVVSGLWHGANWTFVAWGAIHGLYQVIADLLYKPRKALREKMGIQTDVFSWKFLNIIVTFILTDFAWIFFRADSITDALRFIKRILTVPTPWLLFNGGIFELGLDRVEMNILVVSVVMLLLVDLIRYKKQMTIDKFLLSQNYYFQVLVVVVLISMIFVFGEYGPAYDAQQFIYFQF